MWGGEALSHSVLPVCLLLCRLSQSIYIYIYSCVCVFVWPSSRRMFPLSLGGVLWVSVFRRQNRLPAPDLWEVQPQLNVYNTRLQALSVADCSAHRPAALQFQTPSQPRDRDHLKVGRGQRVMGKSSFLPLNIYSAFSSSAARTLQVGPKTKWPSGVTFTNVNTSFSRQIIPSLNKRWNTVSNRGHWLG